MGEEAEEAKPAGEAQMRLEGGHVVAGARFVCLAYHHSKSVGVAERLQAAASYAASLRPEHHSPKGAAAELLVLPAISASPSQGAVQTAAAEMAHLEQIQVQPLLARPHSA